MGPGFYALLNSLTHIRAAICQPVKLKDYHPIMPGVNGVLVPSRYVQFIGILGETKGKPQNRIATHHRQQSLPINYIVKTS
jgi:hypothetical protein